MNKLTLELSIIIAVRNAANLLNKTLETFPQKSPFCYEIIIQDAMSSDGTEQVIKKYDQLPLSYERALDYGIYDAWNKALCRIRGKWTLFLGAGDIIDWSMLSQCISKLQILPNSIEFYATPVRLISPDGSLLEEMFPSTSPRKDLPQGMSLPHPGVFHRSILFSTLKFDISYRVAGDYDFLCRTLRDNNICVDNFPITFMLIGGISGSMDSMFSSERELLQISRKYFPNSIQFKPLMRLIRSGSYLVIRKLFGVQFANYFADIPRLVQGKTRLWSLQNTVPSTDLPEISTQPSIDLIISTIGRVSELEQLIISFKRQNYKKFNIILADQNPSGFLNDTLTRYPELSITRIILPSQGVSVARNILLKQSEADIIAFPDDDCWYAPDTLAQVVEAFRRHPEAGAVLGYWTPSPQFPQPDNTEQVLSATALFSQGGTCVQFFRAEVVKDLRFDPRLGPGTGLPYGCGEDTDYLLEAHKRAPVWRCPSIRVFHPSPDTHVPSDAKIASYAAGRMYLLKKHAFPLWFRCANVLYPLCMLPMDALRKGRKAARYRWRMFVERLRHFSS